MNSDLALKECMRQFNKIGIYDVKVFKSKSNINLSLNLKSTRDKKSTIISLRMVIQDVAYKFNLGLVDDCHYPKKNIIILFYESHKSTFSEINRYGYIDSHNFIIASYSQFRKTLHAIVKNIIGTMNQVLFMYNENTHNFSNYYVSNSSDIKNASYFAYLMYFACKFLCQVKIKI